MGWYQRRVHGGRSNLVSPATSSKPPSSTFIRMASRLPILLLLCLIPLLASALGEEERSHEVEASSAELQPSVVKREARKCRGKKCNKKKKGAKKGKKGKASRGKTVQQRKINNNKKKGKKERKTLKEKKTGRKNFGEGRQITGNA